MTMLRQAVRPLARAARAPATRTQVRNGSGAPHYHQPSGYIFGEEIPQGQKRHRESWETIFYVGMFGGLTLATVIALYKPDTSIQTWALQEAKARMEARGDKVEYKPSNQ